MTKYNFQFQDEKDSLRPCRLLVVNKTGCNNFVTRLCVAMDDKCEGMLFHRPEWCPLTVIDDDTVSDRQSYESDRAFFDVLRERKSEER